MVHKIRYIGRREDGHILFLNLDAKDAIEKGYTFDYGGYSMTVGEADELCYCMHKYCPNLDVRLNNEHLFTIKELYKSCPAMLLDLLELYGGADYIAQILIGYEELYNQEQIVKQWRENQQ